MQWSQAATGLALGTAALGACGSGASGGLGPSGASGATGAAGPAPDPARPDNASPRTVLILGGTGFLGPALVEAAQARGHTITLFNRGKTNPHMFPNVETLHGDRDGDLDALRGRAWDAVIDTSGYVPRLVRASAELLAESVQQYVFVSSISVYADFPRHGLDERHTLATMDDPASEDVNKHYGALKALCEAAAEAAFPGRTTNVRPGLIVGPLDRSDRFTYWPARVARGGEVLAPGSGDDLVQFIDVRDLAAWMIHTVEQRHVGVFNATGPATPLTMRALLEGCRDALASDATFTWASAAFLEEQAIAPWSDMPVWIPAEGEHLGFASMDFSRAQARGLTYRPLADTVRDTLRWFQAEPAERQATLRAGLAPAREAEVLAAWKRAGATR